MTGQFCFGDKLILHIKRRTRNRCMIMKYVCSYVFAYCTMCSEYIKILILNSKSKHLPVCPVSQLISGQAEKFFCLFSKSAWLAAYKQGLALTSSSINLSLKFIILCCLEKLSTSPTNDAAVPKSTKSSFCLNKEIRQYCSWYYKICSHIMPHNV